MFDKILLPVDDSEYSYKAVITAISLHKKYGSKIIAFFSVQHDFLASQMLLAFPVVAPGYSSSWMYEFSNAELEREEEILGRKVLASAEKMFKDADMNDSNFELRLVKDFPPNKYINNFLKNEGCDLIIIGVKGHNSTIKKKKIGSVTEKITKSIPCNVLIVK